MIVEIDLNVLFGFLSMLAIYEPKYIKLNASLHFVIILARVIILAFLVANRLYLKKTSRLVYVATFFLCAIFALGSVFNGKLGLNVIIEFVNITVRVFLFTDTFEAGYEKGKSRIYGMSLFFVVCCIINTITLFSNYALDFNLKGLYVNYYFLGQDNESVPFYFIGIAVTYVYYAYYSNNILPFMISAACFVFFAFYQRVATAVFAIFVIVLLTFFYFVLFRNSRFNLATWSIAVLIINLLLITTSTSAFESILNTFLFQKYDSLLGRITLWNYFIESAKENILFGNGISDFIYDSSYHGLSSNRYILQHNTHNTLLEVFYNGGLMALIVFFVIQIQTCLKYDYTRNMKKSDFIGIIIVSFMIRGIAEIGVEEQIAILIFGMYIGSFEENSYILNKFVRNII